MKNDGEEGAIALNEEGKIGIYYTTPNMAYVYISIGKVVR